MKNIFECVFSSDFFVDSKTREAYQDNQNTECGADEETLCKTGINVFLVMR